ncbi:MAG: helix-turn-helix domain-containing protein [Clostridiales bacterium]|jgi:YesN/AraC family two-component response regulator|nr:helix-turn-helix domain-containing protein [Clostridiales bacterium]
MAKKILRAVLVNPEETELEQLTDALDWGGLGIELAGTAEDAVEEHIEELDPDIIIADIVTPDRTFRPRMYGVETLAKIRAANPYAKIICISGSGDLEFACQAINMGVSGYLPKPVDAAALESAVTRAAEEKRAETEAEIFYQQYSFLKTREQSRYALAAACLLSGRSDDYAALARAGLPKRFRVGFWAGGEDERRALKADISINIGNGEFILFYFNDLPYYDEALCPGVSDPCEPEDFCFALEEAARRFDLLRGTDGQPHTADESRAKDPFYFNLELKTVLESNNSDKIISFVESYLEPQPMRDLLKAAETCLILTHMHYAPILPQMYGDRDYREYCAQLPECRSRQAVLELFREYFDKIDAYIAGGNDEDIASQIRRRIEERAALPDQIEMADLLDGILLSPGHANLLFKNATGMTVHQYVRAERMNLAAQMLLAHPELKINQVAEKCGFCDSAYFINVFKRTFECTPAQYRSLASVTRQAFAVE